jgi:hypothetical protein
MLTRPRHILYVLIAALVLALVAWLILAAGQTDAPTEPDSSLAPVSDFITLASILTEPVIQMA